MSDQNRESDQGTQDAGENARNVFTGLPFVARDDEILDKDAALARRNANDADQRRDQQPLPDSTVGSDAAG